MAISTGKDVSVLQRVMIYGKHRIMWSRRVRTEAVVVSAVRLSA